MNEYRQVLGNKNFFLLWAGQGISNLGSAINNIALALYITDLTGSVAAVSMLFIVAVIPSILIGPWAGVLVDGWSKKGIIICTDVIRGLLALAMVFTGDLIWLYALAFFMNLNSVFFSPAISSALPRIVKREELVTANALSSSTHYASQLAGPALAGVLIAFFGVQSAFWVNGISFLLSALFELWIKIPEPPRANLKVELLADFREGWRYIRSNVAVQFVIIFFALSALPPMGAIRLLVIVFLRDSMGYSAELYGTLMTINGLGLLLGTFWMGKWGKAFSELGMMVMAMALLGLTTLGLALGKSLWLAGAMLLAMGFTSTLINVAYSTFLQKAVDADKRGRVFSLDIAIGNVVYLLALGSSGFMADTWGTITVMAVGGVMLFLISFGAAKLPMYRQSLEVVEARATA